MDNLDLSALLAAPGALLLVLGWVYLMFTWISTWDLLGG